MADITHNPPRQFRDHLQGGFGVNVKVTSSVNEEGERIYTGHRTDGTPVPDTESNDEIECLRRTRAFVWKDAREGH